MLLSAGGAVVGDELGLFGFAHAAESDRLDLGRFEALAALMQESSADALMPKLRREIDAGTSPSTLAAAAALANARTFGGQDYTGYHCFMAIVPALEMARRLQGRASLLPLFKVLHRNTRQIEGSSETLRKVEPIEKKVADVRKKLLADGRNGRFDEAEALFARVLSEQGPAAAYDALQPLVRDSIDVHQIVLAYRSWDMLQLAGEDNANVLLRQVLRHCIDRDAGRRRRGRPAPAIRTLLPELMTEHGLNRPAERTRRLDARQLDALAADLFASSRDDAARRVAAELGSGTSREDIGEALSLSAVRLLTHDPGRSYGEAGKPKGSVHGASVGLHAADSANAWRGVVAANDPVDADACLITAAWHNGGQSRGMDRKSPHHADHRDAATKVAPEKLLDALAEALRGRDQSRSSALAERYLELGKSPDALVATLIGPATEFDGALHHEKFFHTATVEFARTRERFRDEHLVALTRVMASGYGFEAEGMDAAREALGLKS